MTTALFGGDRWPPAPAGIETFPVPEVQPHLSAMIGEAEAGTDVEAGTRVRHHRGSIRRCPGGASGSRRQLTGNAAPGVFRHQPDRRLGQHPGREDGGTCIDRLISPETMLM